LTTWGHTRPKSLLKRLKSWGSVDPSLPYSPDIAPCDFFLFSYRARILERRTFRSEREVISTVRWEKKCIELSGECLPS
jgi:hypothetical protein